jgi:hypothetical protein
MAVKIGAQFAFHYMTKHVSRHGISAASMECCVLQDMLHAWLPTCCMHAVNMSHAAGPCTLHVWLPTYGYWQIACCCHVTCCRYHVRYMYGYRHMATDRFHAVGMLHAAVATNMLHAWLLACCLLRLFRHDVTRACCNPLRLLQRSSCSILIMLLLEPNQSSHDRVCVSVCMLRLGHAVAFQKANS